MSTFRFGGSSPIKNGLPVNATMPPEEVPVPPQQVFGCTAVLVSTDNPIVYGDPVKAPYHDYRDPTHVIVDDLIFEIQEHLGMAQKGDLHPYIEHDSEMHLILMGLDLESDTKSQEDIVEPIKFSYQNMPTDKLRSHLQTAIGNHLRILKQRGASLHLSQGHSSATAIRALEIAAQIALQQ